MYGQKEIVTNQQMVFSGDVEEKLSPRYSANWFGVEGDSLLRLVL